MDKSEEVSLGQWQSDLATALREFSEYWRRMHESAPQAYPAQLGRGDWDEQFDLWQDERRIVRRG